MVIFFGGKLPEGASCCRAGGSESRRRRAGGRTFPSLNWRIACTFQHRMKYEISIRLLSDGSGFFYTVRRGAKLMESEIIRLTDPVSTEAPSQGEYYGNSKAMD